MHTPVRRRTTASTTSPQGTNLASRRTLSFQVQAQRASSAQEPAVKTRTFPVYHLRWERLKDYLQRRFPDFQFGDERRVNGDRYLFQIPESLKSVDFTAIEGLRDEEDANEPPRLAASPEPE